MGIHSLRFISREKRPGDEVVILKTSQLHMTDVMNWWRVDQRLGRGQG